MNFQFKTIKPWVYPSNYCGEDYSEYYRSLGQSRDSDILEVSNFACLLEKLGGESKHVIVARASHWAVGWVESILVHKTVKTKLKLLDDLMTKFQDYPVIDDNDYSERKHESYLDYALSAQDDLAEALAKHFNVPNNKYLKELALELNMEDQYQSGSSSCINVYTYRKPDTRDVNQLKDTLMRIGHNIGKKTRKTYDRLVKAVDDALTSSVEQKGAVSC